MVCFREKNDGKEKCPESNFLQEIMVKKTFLAYFDQKLYFLA